MKFYRNLAIVIVILGGAILLLKLGSPNLVQPPSNIPPTTASPAPGSPADQAQPGQSAPGAATPAPAQTVAPSPTPDVRMKIYTLAQQLGVTIVSYSENGKTLTIVLDWASDSTGPGFDLLDEGIKQGIFRNFKELDKTMYYDRGGRRHWKLACELQTY